MSNAECGSKAALGDWGDKKKGRGGTWPLLTEACNWEKISDHKNISVTYPGQFFSIKCINSAHNIKTDKSFLGIFVLQIKKKISMS